MIHPDTEVRFISREIGYGVVATRLIPRGTVTWALDRLDREFTPGDVRQLPAPYQDVLSKYAYRNNRGNYVLCWDNGRYVNHSFHSNCLTTAYDFELAVRDIAPGEELTDDYGYLNVDEPFRGLDEGTRRKVVYPDDLVRYHKVWDRKLLRAFKKLTRVPQPLQPVVDEHTWERARRVAEGAEPMESILSCYYAATSP